MICAAPVCQQQLPVGSCIPCIQPGKGQPELSSPTGVKSAESLRTAVAAVWIRWADFREAVDEELSRDLFH